MEYSLKERKKSNPGLLDQMGRLGADLWVIGLGWPRSRSPCRHSRVRVYSSGCAGGRGHGYMEGGGVCVCQGCSERADALGGGFGCLDKGLCLYLYAIPKK